MNFFPNEIQHDDTNNITLDNAQSVSRPVSFRQEFHLVITTLFKPPTMSTKDVGKDQTLPNLFPDPLTMSETVSTTTKDHNEHTSLQDTTIEDSSKAQVIRSELNNNINDSI